MKTFEQLNDVELVNLTEEQIQHYIKLKKAETGIKIIAMPETPKYAEIPAPDMEMYEVCGYVFKEKEKAEEIASVINKNIATAYKQEYDYWRSGDSSKKYAKPYDGSLESVNIVRLYSQPVYNSIKDTIQSNNKIKEAYEKIERAWKEEDEKASEIIESITDAIAKARERIAQFKEYKTRIVEYLQLANGNRDVAWNFFDKAYAIEPSVKNMVMESEEYQKAVDAYINA